MAQIPLGAGRRVLPQRAGNVGVPREAGMASARALDQLGQVATGSAMQMMGDETRLQAQETQRQKQLADAAKRQDQAIKLQQTQDALRDLHDEVATGIQQGTVPKDDAERLWSERSGKVISDAAGGFEADFQGLARKQLEGTGLQLGNSMRRVREKQDRQDISAGINTSLEYLQRQYRTDPAGAERQAMATIDQMGAFSTFTPTELASKRQTWKEGVQFATGYEAVSAGKNDRKALAKSVEVVNGMTDLDPQKRTQLLDRAQAYSLHMDQQDELRAARQQREGERRMKQAEAEFTTFRAMADRGTVMAPDYIDRAMRATAGTPYQAGVVALAKQAAETGGFAAQPISVQQQAVDALDAKMAQTGRTPELDKRRQQMQLVLNGSKNDLSADPLRAGLERGVIVSLPPLNMQAGLPGVMSQLQERGVQADRVSTWAGRPVAPMTQQEAEVLSGFLKSMPVEQRATALQTLSAAIPAQQGQALAALMDKADRPTALALALGGTRTTFDRPVSELLLRGAEALKAGTIKEEKTPVDGWKARIALAMEKAYANPVQAGMAAEAARYILAGQIAEGTAAGSEDDVRRAVRMAVGGTLPEHNGLRIVLPAGVERQQFEQHLVNYAADKLAPQMPDGKAYVRGQPVEAAQFLASLPAAQLRTVGRGRYLVQSHGVIVVNSKMQPIVIEAPDAR